MLGSSMVCSRVSPVRGDVLWLSSHSRIVARSNVNPSAVHTGSRISVMPIGHSRLSGTLSTGAATGICDGPASLGGKPGDVKPGDGKPGGGKPGGGKPGKPGGGKPDDGDPSGGTAAVGCVLAARANVLAMRDIA